MKIDPNLWPSPPQKLQLAAHFARLWAKKILHTLEKKSKNKLGKVSKIDLISKIIDLMDEPLIKLTRTTLWWIQQKNYVLVFLAKYIVSILLSHQVLPRSPHTETVDSSKRISGDSCSECRIRSYSCIWFKLIFCHPWGTLLGCVPLPWFSKLPHENRMFWISYLPIFHMKCFSFSMGRCTGAE